MLQKEREAELTSDIDTHPQESDSDSVPELTSCEGTGANQLCLPSPVPDVGALLLPWLEWRVEF